MNLSCGIEASAKRWSGLFMSYPIFLLPYVIFNYIKLGKIPQLFKSAVTYFIFQYYFYLTFYYLYNIAVLFTGILLVMKEESGTELRIALDVLDQLQILALIISINLSDNSINKIRSFFGMSRKSSIKEPLLNKEGSFHSSSSVVTGDIEDSEFINRYDADILKRHSMLQLKTSFHLINSLLIGICHMFKEKDNDVAKDEDLDIDYTEEAKVRVTHDISPKTFTEQNVNQCIYEAEEGKLIVVEHAPQIFGRLRKQAGLTSKNILDCFFPINNEISINNFFQGSGKSESFFFFTQNQEFVLKTMKESEMKLLLDTPLLANYAKHMRGHPDSTLSRFYGVYTFKLGEMDDIHCFITNNLIGKEFPNVERIYDLKGSTAKRRTKLTAKQNEVDGVSGMKVLKDLNFQDVHQKLKINQDEKTELLDRINVDSKFLAENNLMDYSVLFIQFDNKEVTQDEDMPAMQLREVNGEVMFSLLKDSLMRKMTVMGKLDSVPEEDEEEKFAINHFETSKSVTEGPLLNKLFKAEGLQAKLKRSIIKKFLNERINKKF